MSTRVCDLPLIGDFRFAINFGFYVALVGVHAKAYPGNTLVLERLDAKGVQTRSFCTRVYLGLDAQQAELGKG